MAGLIRRTPHPQDRRMLHVELTRRGRELVRRVEEEHRQGEQQLLGCLEPREREALEVILSKLQAHLQSLGST
jgi:DNA-binding MarR family transcriptional regulator